MLAIPFIPSGERGGGLATAIAIVQGFMFLVAAGCEVVVRRRKGTEPSGGSKVGNFLAAMFGLILLAYAALAFVRYATGNT